MTENPTLLHNFGAPPTAFIRWNGLTGSREGTDGPGERDAPGRGCWLYCRHRFDYANTVDWNRCTELLERVRPCHGLRETQARTALIDAMEAHLQELDWPPVLVCSTGHFDGITQRDHLILDHPLTTFVALGKCIGSLWLRDTPWRLAPLNTPAVIESGGAGYGRGTYWGCRLWFPEGLPPALLDRVRAGAKGVGEDRR